MTFGNFVSMDPWMCSLRYLWWRQIRIRSDSFRVLRHVISLLAIEIHELGTRFYKEVLSHLNYELLCLLCLTRLHVPTTNLSFLSHLI